MTYRKTWFSYVLWMIYTMLCAVFLVFVGNYVCVSCFSNSSLLPDRVIRWSGLLLLPVVAVSYWIIRVVSGQIRKRNAGREKSWKVLEIIVVWLLFAIGIFRRITYVLNCMQNPSETKVSGQINGIEYFDMAMVTESGRVEPLAYGGAYLYVLCLSFVLSFLGNKIVSAVVFQFFLQIAGMVLAYAVTRRIAGRVPACTVLLYLACSVGYLEMLGNLGPECLFFVLYMLVMLAVVSYVKGYCANRFKKAPALAGAAIAGIFIGMLGYLDLTAVTILPVMTAAATGKKRQSEDRPVICSPGMNGLVITTAGVSCAAGFSGISAVVSICRGNGFVREWNQWAALHIGNTQTFGFRPLYPYSLDMFLFGVLASLAAFLVFDFFRSGREQNYMLWILLCIVAAPTPLAVFGVQPFGILSMYIWSVLAGLGLQNGMFGGKAEFLQSMIAEINRAAEELETAEENGAEETPEPSAEAEAVAESETSEETEAVDVPVISEETSAEEVQAPEPSAEASVVDVPEAAAAIDKIPKPRYLENPLPLPKKHVRRKMDYQYSVSEEDMKFDVEIDEEDDYDI